MNFGKNNQLISAMSELKDADYSKNPKLGDIYKRLLKGRKQFENVMNKDIQAIMQISSLDLTLKYVTDEMNSVSEAAAEGIGIIHAAAQECSMVAEQVNGQHEELTNTIIRAAEDTDEVYKKIEAGQNELSLIKELSVKTIGESKEMQKDMDVLLNIINHMNEVIAGINSISSQTNLLALNASIEAARAGEAGRGFAVVADEIRELSERTRRETENIANILDKLTTNADQTAQAVEKTVEVTDVQDEMISEIAEKVNEVSINVEGLVGDISEIDKMLENLSEANSRIVENIETISATTEEVTAAVQESAAITESNYEDAVNTQEILRGVMEASHRMDKYMN